MALSIGYAAPAGKATGATNDSLSAAESGQFPLSLEIGGNATPSLFLGGYVIYAPGGVAGTLNDTCSANQLDCSAHSIHGGLAIRYRFLPGQRVEPWIGFAAGYESNNLSLTNPRTSATQSLEITGWEYGHFSAGVDFLAHPAFAFGPFVDFAVGQYGHAHETLPQGQTRDDDITNTDLHEWITIGIRSVIMP